MEQGRSRNGVVIRLTDERWQHILEEHGELRDLRAQVIGAIENPERILSGTASELLALTSLEPGKLLVVVYREVNERDGFVITAFITRRLNSLNRRQQVWPLPS